MPTITYARYFDRVLGAWMGAFAGASLGGKRSGQKEFAATKLDQKHLAKLAPADATELAVLWTHALKEHGPHLTSKSLAEEWQQHFASHRAEFGIARRNWLLGVHPSASGRHTNEFFGESMGAAARAFVWGLVCPGASKSATRYARRDAELDHHDQGVESAMFAAALVAAAFFESDVETLVRTSSHQIDTNTLVARLIRDVLRWTAEEDIEQCYHRIRLRYATPDYTRSLVNLGFVLAALLKCKGNLEQSILAVASCGYDASRNGALVGAVAGCLTGESKIPGKWKTLLGKQFACTLGQSGGPILSDFTFAALAEHTCRLGMEIGSVLETRIEFVQAPPTITVLDHNPMFVKVMDLFVEYAGAPSLRFGDDRPVRLKIVSRNPRRMQGIFRLQSEKELLMHPNAFPLDIGPYETRTIETRATFARECRRLPMRNLVAATFEINKKAIYSDRFGVVASGQWLALGPFWKGAKTKGNLAAFMEEAGFDAKWLPEPDIDEKTKPRSGKSFERVILHADNDLIPLDHVFPPTGPCTVYLVAEIHSPLNRKATIWLGTAGPAKLWVNKKLVAHVKGHQFFTPFTAEATTRLLKGRNLVLLKVARTDRHFSVRVGFKEAGKGDSLESRWLTDLAWGRFEI